MWGKQSTLTQGKLYRKIGDKVEAIGLFVLPEQRVRVSVARVRVPDVCVVAKIDKEIMMSRRSCVSKFSRQTIAGAALMPRSATTKLWKYHAFG